MRRAGDSWQWHSSVVQFYRITRHGPGHFECQSPHAGDLVRHEVQLGGAGPRHVGHEVARDVEVTTSRELPGATDTARIREIRLCPIWIPGYPGGMTTDETDPYRLRTGAWPPGTKAPARVAKRVIVLPGRAYPIDAPLLFWTGFALVEDGWFVQSVGWYQPPLDRGFVCAALQSALNEAPLADRTLVVAKSLGTHAAPVAAQLRLPAVWLTPVLTDAVVREELSSYPAPQLTIGGSADPLWPVDAPHPSGEVMYVEGADHGMSVGGVRESNAVHMDVVDRVRAFAGSL